MIRLNSPNLNYLVITGMILLYCGGIGFVIPVTYHQAVPPICMVSKLANSLCVEYEVNAFVSIVKNMDADIWVYIWLWNHSR